MPYRKQMKSRQDLDVIYELIQPNSSVLDLGCGEGDLLQKLIAQKKVRGHGVEIYDEYVFECIAKGVPVIQQDLDEGLGEYPDHSFDYVVLSQTLQQVLRPDDIITEMLRVGETGIVGFLNFAYWRVINYLVFTGTMPKSRALPHEWYNTPNIHLSTIKDFENLCREKNVHIKNQINLVNGKKAPIFANLFPNTFAELAIFVIEKAG